MVKVSVGEEHCTNVSILQLMSLFLSRFEMEILAR